MKKNISATVLVFIAVFFILAVSEQPAKSATLGLGATGWYAWWSPKPDNSSVEMDSAMMYGPQILLQVSPQWTISSVFIFGEFQYKRGNEPAMDIMRYDSDTTVSYSLNQIFRLFGGLKIMGYHYEHGDHRGWGPGFGASLVLPMAENLFFSIILSGFYLWAEQEDEYSAMDYSEYGASVSVSFVYVIPSSSVSFSIGGRYFYFETKPDQIYNYYRNEKHHFYGITASAMYMISL